MNYEQTLNYLYESLPMFQRQGKSALKKDLTNTLLLCEKLDNPHHKFKSIHVAGTNGKGSTAHSIAAIFQVAGYKTGLHTSPHLKNFTERIKINGKEIKQESVIQFVSEHKSLIEEIKPSFFEISVVMAFHHFAQEMVDIAVIEVGLGGRLDSTNVITPELSVITNISKDHTDLLGNDIRSIAREKAGIIKSETPVVVSEYQEEVFPVFEETARERNAPIHLAFEHYEVVQQKQGLLVSDLKRPDHSVIFNPDLKGEYHKLNIPGILTAIEVMISEGWKIDGKHIKEGIEQASLLTNFKGRWQQLGTDPLMICDIAHNAGGISPIVEWINARDFNQVHIVWGMVKDKDIDEILKLLPKYAVYYFSEADIPRALSTEQLRERAREYGLNGEGFPNVNKAISAARSRATKNDFIFIGGSAFLVAEIENL